MQHGVLQGRAGTAATRSPSMRRGCARSQAVCNTPARRTCCNSAVSQHRRGWRCCACAPTEGLCRYSQCRPIARRAPTPAHKHSTATQNKPTAHAGTGYAANANATARLPKQRRSRSRSHLAWCTLCERVATGGGAPTECNILQRCARCCKCRSVCRSLPSKMRQRWQLRNASQRIRRRQPCLHRLDEVEHADAAHAQPRLARQEDLRRVDATARKPRRMHLRAHARTRACLGVCPRASSCLDVHAACCARYFGSCGKDAACYASRRSAALTVESAAAS